MFNGSRVVKCGLVRRGSRSASTREKMTGSSSASPGSTDTLTLQQQRADVLRDWEQRKAAVADEVDRQRSRANWASAGVGRDGFNPTTNGLVAGVQSALMSGTVGGVLVYAAHRMSDTVRMQSAGGKVWLVAIFTMAGFFVSSEQAVAGSDARAARQQQATR